MFILVDIKKRDRDNRIRPVAIMYLEPAMYDLAFRKTITDPAIASRYITKDDIIGAAARIHG
jgi:hypothetical protein